MLLKFYSLNLIYDIIVFTILTAVKLTKRKVEPVVQKEEKV